MAVADKLSSATLPPSGNTLPLRGLKMAVAEAEAVAAAVSLSATVHFSSCFIPIGWQKLFQAAITTANNAVATIWRTAAIVLLSRKLLNTFSTD